MDSAAHAVEQERRLTRIRELERRPRAGGGPGLDGARAHGDPSRDRGGPPLSAKRIDRDDGEGGRRRGGGGGGRRKGAGAGEGEGEDRRGRGENSPGGAGHQRARLRANDRSAARTTSGA